MKLKAVHCDVALQEKHICGCLLHTYVVVGTCLTCLHITSLPCGVVVSGLAAEEKSLRWYCMHLLVISDRILNMLWGFWCFSALQIFRVYL
jgi:hypothetical protein